VAQCGAPKRSSDHSFYRGVLRCDAQDSPSTGFHYLVYPMRILDWIHKRIRESILIFKISHRGEVRCHLSSHMGSNTVQRRHEVDSGLVRWAVVICTWRVVPRWHTHPVIGDLGRGSKARVWAALRF
jgi:hypothetical protein